MSLTITTNNVPRFTIDAYQLTATERADLGLSSEPTDTKEGTYIRYRGELYPVGDFDAVSTLNPEGASHHDLRGWDGYLTDSMSSGVVIRFPDPTDFETVVVGRFYS